TTDCRDQVVRARIEHQCEEINARERQPVFAVRGPGAGSDREIDIAAQRFGVRSLRSAFEKRSGAGRERETGFAAPLNGGRSLRSTVDMLFFLCSPKVQSIVVPVAPSFCRARLHLDMKRDSAARNSVFSASVTAPNA